MKETGSTTAKAPLLAKSARNAGTLEDCGARKWATPSDAGTVLINEQRRAELRRTTPK